MRTTANKYQDRNQNEVLLATSDTLFTTHFLQKKRLSESSEFRSNHDVSPYNHSFTFTGKEWCKSQWLTQRGPERGISETGYGYFGARYMDHELMTMWLSVDPMSDKYPSISPYAYCAWNPVKLVDPNGEDIWELNDEGKLVWIKESKYEIIKYGSHSITNKKNCIFGKSEGPKTISLDEGIWKFGADDRNAEMYFEFFADHLDYEFSLFGFENGNKINYELTTWLDPITDENGKLEIKGISDKLRVHVHNHTNGFPNPSTSDNHLGDGNDLDFSESIISSSPNCSFFIYTKDNGGVYSKYNVNGDCGPNIPSRFDKPQYGLQLDKISGWIRPSPLFDNRYH